MLIFFLTLLYADVSLDIAEASNTSLEEGVRQEAFLRLVREGNADAEPLFSIANDIDSDVQKRWIVIRALGKIGGKKVIQDLLPLLKDKRSEIRIATCSALGENRLWSVTEDLLLLLEDQVLLVRVASAQALGEIANPTAIEGLERALRAPDHFYRGKSLWVRAHFVEALGKIRNKKAYPALLYAIDDQDSGVYKAAIIALEQIVGFSLSEGRNGQEEREAWKRWLSKELSR